MNKHYIIKFALIVCSCILIILSGQLFVRRYQGITPRQKQDYVHYTEDTMVAIIKAIHLFDRENGAFPDALNDLLKKPNASFTNWHGPYVNITGEFLDYWGHPILYRIQQNGYVLRSLGADRTTSSDDILLRVDDGENTGEEKLSRQKGDE